MSEPDFKATPEQIARITSAAIHELSKTHVILTKEELKGMIAAAIDGHSSDLWDLVLSTYAETGVQLSAVITPERLKGFQLGEKLLQRMALVAKEENSAVFSPKSA